MVLATNKEGQELIEFIQVTEQVAFTCKYDHPITSSFAFIKCENNYLVAYNKWRSQWEFPAGKIEVGETPKECAIRELFEETGQRVPNLDFKGLFKIYDERSNQIKYRAVYYAEVHRITDFRENDEMSDLMLWDLKSSIGYVDEVDLKMLFMCLELYS